MVFGDELRPVKLRTVVKGYANTKTDFLFERRLNDYLLGVIQDHSQQKPSLVFCRCILLAWPDYRRMPCAAWGLHLQLMNSHHFIQQCIQQLRHIASMS